MAPLPVGWEAGPGPQLWKASFHERTEMLRQGH
jgi:hypothetical protein